ncbi:MAG TPA: DUF6161 domain-containing protein [Flavobacterium sp.]|uniref:DUF6161 domain-containing protein n=1 Tax=Flavobacterium sp. TaxID=239 RepID=UPI002DB8F051|nr:DUF6161 domain-containing protein [Flavobacterium sp.]HEU4791623.1 DUF6161 domain-containing protein [Flavobacterium sp.]
MTTTELKRKIAESESKDWFKEKSQNFNFSYINFNSDITGVSAIYEFVNQQINGWESLEKNLPEELQNSLNYFIGIRDSISGFVENHSIQPTNVLDSYWNNIITTINNIRQYPLTYNCPESDFLVTVHKNFPASISGAFYFITGQLNASIIQDKNYYIGTQLAYEFAMKDQTEILQRRNAEKSSLNKIRNEFNQYLTKSESEIVEHISNTNEKYEEYTEAIDTLKNDKELLFSEWFETSKTDFEIFDTESKEKVINLEKAYQELLSLKKPAEYWKLRASKLKEEGWSAIYWLIGLILFACLSLYLLLWLTPEGMLLSFINGQASAIKWSIIYVTFIAFLTYGIRALNKIAFSSFHLARDAEEREQLTFVYLALIKDGSVDEKDRSLIMQSLFSRADTGLLKEDSSPTMPNDIVGKLFSK